MSATLKSHRALSNPTRLRIVALLEKDELSVNELQEVTRLGQSRISTHLGLLADRELVGSRREGKRRFYKLNPQADPVASDFIQLAICGAKELAEQASDQINLKRVLARRKEQAQVFFNQVAGRFDRVYGPGRSWQAFLKRRTNFMVIAGRGLLKVICTAGWRRPGSRKLKSASWPRRSHRRIFRPCLRAGKNDFCCSRRGEALTEARNLSEPPHVSCYEISLSFAQSPPVLPAHHRMCLTPCLLSCRRPAMM